jgi:hypothetical protein
VLQWYVVGPSAPYLRINPRWVCTTHRKWPESCCAFFSVMDNTTEHSFPIRLHQKSLPLERSGISSAFVQNFLFDIRNKLFFSLGLIVEPLCEV